jgi:hypothetical protein
LSGKEEEKMKSFKEYLSEIFNPPKVHSKNEANHPDLIFQGSGIIEYRHEPKDNEGKVIPEKIIHTRFGNLGGKFPNERWEAMFDVGGKHTKGSGKDFPSDVAERVFGHLTDFVNTRKKLTGEAPRVHYHTPNVKKHRIYQTVAKRLGIEAINSNPLFDPMYAQPKGG